MKFKNISLLIRDSRIKSKLSQNELGSKLKVNGQLISNIERGVASLPESKIKITSDILNIDSDLVIESIILDYRLHLRKIVKNKS